MKMKYLNKIFLSVFLGVILVTSCDTEQLHDLNINPQAVKEINLNFFFTGCELGAASGGDAGDNRYIDWRTNIGMCAYAIQHLGHISGGIAPGDKYTDNFETSSAPFEFMYGTQLKHLTEIINQTGEGGYDEGNKNNLRQASRILRAFLFQRLTDYYGSVPYSEALQANTGGEFYPVYDKQKAIYTDLFKELEEATAALSGSEADQGFKNADIIYNGDIAKWKRFGFSLMLRMAMRISNVDAATAATYVGKAVAGGVFTSNSDNVWVPMAVGPSLWTNQNGISRAFIAGDGGQPTYMGKTLIDFLKGTDQTTAADDDPRLLILSGGVKGNMDPLKQKGIPNGKNQTLLEAFEGKSPIVLADDYSVISTKFFDRDEPYMLMNYGEVEFLLAEAAERTIGGVTAAQTHYNNGVKASMQMYTPYDASFTVSDAAVTTYLTTYPYGGPKAKLAMIGDQQWANHFFNWWEAWSHWRRTGLPALVAVNYPGNVTNGTIPVRLKYPNAEASGNPNFAATSTTPNLYTTKVWWAGGPE